LLIAYQLDLLDLLENLEFPIKVSPNAVDALFQLESASRHHQPARIAAFERILEKVNAGEIEVTNPEEEPSFSRQTETIGCTALPPRCRDRGECFVVDHHIPDGFRGRYQESGRYTVLRAVSDGLYASGALTESEFNDAIENLGTYGKDQSGEIPSAGDDLFFLANTIGVLAEAGLLEQACSAFRVHAQKWFLEQAEREVDAAARGEKLARSLASVRSRVSQSILSGRIVTTAPAQFSQQDEKPGRSLSPLELCLADSLSTPTSDNSVVWIDDRYLSSFEASSGGKIVGIVEILDALLNSSLIPIDFYYDRLLRLRASNMMFLSIEPEEVRYHVLRAPIRNGSLVETPALSIFRRYLGKALLLDRHLKIGNLLKELAGRPDEISFLMNIRRLCEAVIIADWSDPNTPIEVCRARSSWYWSRLRVERILRIEDEPEIRRLIFRRC
jgi:hypothetical protein